MMLDVGTKLRLYFPSEFFFLVFLLVDLTIHTH